MKKIVSILMVSIGLSACASTDGGVQNQGQSNIDRTIGSIFTGTEHTSTDAKAQGITANLIRMYVNNQCVNYLQARQEWRFAALAMSAEKKAEWEGRICGCVSEEAPNHITAADLVGVMTEAGRAKLMTEITTKTVTACYKRLVTGVLTGK